MTKITLTDPITIDGMTYTFINLRRPKVRDRLVVERLKKTDAEKEIAMIANLAEVEISVIEELDLSDYSQIQRHLTDFLAWPPETLESP